MFTFQQMLQTLTLFWEKQGCTIHHPYDLEKGAGTFNPVTFLRALGPEPYRAFYYEPSRRPTDGRYGTNPNRLQHYFQGQVILKPSPPNIQDLCLQSLEAIGFNLNEHDMRFVHDDWESPTLGAWGLGWEVWMDGMEVTQFTYFQSVAGIPLKPITGEVTYGLERLAMHLQKVNSIYDIQWNDKLTYGDIYHRNEVEWSHYNFEHASTDMWFRQFADYEKEAKKLVQLNLPIPAYDFVIKASHAFNMLDARGVISVTERTGYIARIRDIACLVAASYLKSREKQGYPLLQKMALPKAVDGYVEPLLAEELKNPNSTQKEDFLLEVGSEELPATFVPLGCANLEKAMRTLLEKEGIPFKGLKAYGTPRRLAVYVEQLALSKPATTVEKKGPALEQAFDAQGRCKPAGEGFFRSLNIPAASLEQIRKGAVSAVEVRSLKGAEYLFGTLHTAGRPTAEILKEQLPALILNLEFPKKMRWGDLDISYARALRWIVALFGKHLIPFTLGDIHSDRKSWGHRQLDHKDFSLAKAADYLPQLKDHKVMADAAERKKSIVEQIDALEKTLKGQVIAREQVLPQVVNLVEWPFVTYAEFDKAFLKAPKEVLVSEMVEHQKYFPVANPDGTLKNNFVITANTTPTDVIRQGNQKALSPRLYDGMFLYEQGVKVKLDSLNEKLKQVTFQKDLGTVYEKVQRIIAHTAVLQKLLNISTSTKARRAAELCKADIASEMVYEFPDLQGVIGHDYARAQGEDPEVALAIEEHWMPRGENAPLPSSPTGTLVSMAEKIDNLLGCYSANLKPTSSSDPYALRRQALGLMKMLIQGQYRMPLMSTLRTCLQAFPKVTPEQREPLLQELETFLIPRLKTVFLDYGFKKDEIEAGLSHNFEDVYDAFKRVEALHKFRDQNDKFPLLYEVYKRAKGQLNDHVQASFSAQLLQETAEKDLDASLSKTETPFKEALQAQNYDHAYEIIAGMQPLLAALFDQVKILADDPALQKNRIALLQKVFNRFSLLLDFSKLQAG